MSAGLVGREKERAFCLSWAESLLDSGRGGSLYVSGTPGSGKTATLTSLAEHLASQGRCVYKRLNCMSVTPPKSLFPRLIDLLREDAENSPPKRTRGAKTAGGGAGEEERTLLEAIRALDQPLLLILDEMDQLMEAEPEVLYKAFGLPAKPRLRLLLVGIANQLDLTERFLPKLKVQAKRGVPTTLSFAPYTAAQLSAILAGVGGDGGEAASRELLSRKISAGDGDVRKALAVWDSVERKSGKRGTGVGSVLAELRATTASPVARARLTAEQKLLLGAALRLRRGGRTGFSLRELEEEWRRVAERLGREAGDEAGEAAALLEAQGLLESSTPRSTKKAPLSRATRTSAFSLMRRTLLLFCRTINSSLSFSSLPTKLPLSSKLLSNLGRGDTFSSYYIYSRTAMFGSHVDKSFSFSTLHRFVVSDYLTMYSCCAH